MPGVRYFCCGKADAIVESRAEQNRAKWEQDLRNRQRNIVFPDNMLNEFRGLRYVLSDKVRLTPVMRFCVVLLGIPLCVSGAMAVKELAGIFRSTDDGFIIAFSVIIFLVPAAVWISVFLLGAKMLIKSVTPSASSSEISAPMPPSRTGTIRRPFSQRPRQRQLRARNR